LRRSADDGTVVGAVKKVEAVMRASNVRRSEVVMTDDSNDVILFVTERFERRLAEEGGKLRVEMATEFGKVRTEMALGFGGLRAEMIDRNHALLKWILGIGITQTAALAGLLNLWR